MVRGFTLFGTFNSYFISSDYIGNTETIKTNVQVPNCAEKKIFSVCVCVCVCVCNWPGPWCTANVK